MTQVSLKDAKAGFSSYVDQAAGGAFVTITRHGKPAAVLVSVDAANLVMKSMKKDRPSMVDFLATFPADIDLDDDVFARNPSPSRDLDF